MDLIQDRFPVFEPNQVLTSEHLNDIFSYLDEQSRLSRANLIGIGIVCGLDISLDGDGKTIRLTKGCGVTSQGYLIVEPTDLSLVSYRSDYTIPVDPDYPSFKNEATRLQYPLWELFPNGEPNTKPLDSIPGFLDDKAVLLFLELEKKGLRNCSPNNCDDIGSEVIASVKRLLIKIDDLAAIIATTNSFGSGLTDSDLEAAFLTKLNLPDIRVPRFDVLASSPVTSNDIYAAFLNVFRKSHLAQTTAEALTSAYLAFKPLLKDTYPVNPFADFNSAFSFLDSAPSDTAQVHFLQYYFDLFDDLLRAYDEFRWQGVELVCACVPPGELFPRHLMLGLLHPEAVTLPDIYRSHFLASSALSSCVERSKYVLQLFQRLVEMASSFTNTPSLPSLNKASRVDPQIRITPSVLNGTPLATTAIPYYYEQNGAPPLYTLWNSEKTKRNRSNQNLSYRYDEYVPTPPPFVSSPLSYDLGCDNFLRIEGHLGKNYRLVLATLLLLKSQNRLPFEIVALRSGAYDDSQPVDLSKEFGRFQDLEAVYDALREELLSSLAEGMMFLYSLAIKGSPLPGSKPNHPLLQTYAPNYYNAAGTIGSWYEKYLTLFQARPYIDVNQNQIDATAVFFLYCNLFAGTTAGSDELPALYYPHVVSIYYFSKLAEILPKTLSALDFGDFQNKYQDLQGLARYFRSDAASHISEEFQAFAPQEDLIDHFDQVLFSCKLDPIKSIHDEYLLRTRDLRKKQFLGHFLQLHPGIQHKAGVPLGGTFIIVYHQDPTPVQNLSKFEGSTLGQTIPARSNNSGIKSSIETEASRSRFQQDSLGEASTLQPGDDVNTLALADAINRIRRDRDLVMNPDIHFLLDSLSGRVRTSSLNQPLRRFDDHASKIISSAVDELEDGTVLADFYLPYLISSDHTPVQFVLPRTRPTISAKIGCQNDDGFSSVEVTTQGGLPPYDIKVDELDYQELHDTLDLTSGSHTLKVRDADYSESAEETITVPERIELGEPAFQCSENNSTYIVTVSIRGGIPPYIVNDSSIKGDTYRSDAIEDGKAVTIKVMDSDYCTRSFEFTHTCCDLPCAGIALNSGYRFWLPEPSEKPLKEFNFSDVKFEFEFPQGTMVDLSNEFAKVMVADIQDLNKNFTKVVQQKWLAQINKLIGDRTGRSDWLTLTYKTDKPDDFGILRVEYFACLKFNIHVMSNFRRSDSPEKVEFTLAPEGTVMVYRLRERPETVNVPAFDTIKIDKCHPAGSSSTSSTLTKKISKLNQRLSARHPGGRS